MNKNKQNISKQIIRNNAITTFATGGQEGIICATIS